MTLSGRTYICSAGEMVDMVARIVYGDEKYACEILCANPEHSLTQVFDGGEILQLPVVEIPDNNTGAVRMSDIAPWKVV